MKEALITSITDILQKKVLNRIYDRGLQIYLDQKLKLEKLEVLVGGVEVKYTVHGTIDYTVDMVINIDRISHGCGCPYNQSPFCKHSVAVLFGCER